MNGTMGYLTYNKEQFDIDDRTLAHIGALIAVKLRRHEPFMITLTLPQQVGGGRRSLWIENGVPLHFTFFGNRAAALNDEWVAAMLDASSSTLGVQLSPEPDRSA